MHRKRPVGSANSPRVARVKGKKRWGYGSIRKESDVVLKGMVYRQCRRGRETFSGLVFGIPTVIPALALGPLLKHEQKYEPPVYSPEVQS